MPYGKPVAAQRRPSQDPRAGKFNQKSSFKAGTATDSAASHDVDDFDRQGLSGRPHVEEGSTPVSVIARYATLGRALKTNESFAKVAQQIAQIAEMAEQTVMQEAGDWFDQHTIKRNMKEMKNYAGQFAKIAEELDTLQQRATALYDDMGNVLTRYFELNDDTEDPNNPPPGDEVGRTEFDRGAVGMGNQGQQGWTEGADDQSDLPEYDPEQDAPYERQAGSEMDRLKGAARKVAGAVKPRKEAAPLPKKPEAEYQPDDLYSSLDDDPRTDEDSPAEQGNRAGAIDAFAAKLGIQMEPGESRSEYEDRVRQAARNRSQKEGRGFSTPGSQDYKDNFKTRGIAGEALDPAKKKKIMALAAKANAATNMGEWARLMSQIEKMTTPAEWAELTRSRAFPRENIYTAETAEEDTEYEKDAWWNQAGKGVTKEARGSIANFKGKAQQPFSASNQPTKEQLAFLAREFAQNRPGFDRVVKTLHRNEVKAILKSGRARSLKEARKLVAREALNRTATKALQLAERGPVRSRLREAVTPDQKLAQLQKIVTDGQYGKVDGQKVDLFSAGAILAVYKALNDENKQKFLALPVLKMARLAFKLVK